jgi:hypothetical protein
VGEKLQRWNELVAKVAFVQLDDQCDSIKWNLTKQGTFTMQSMYQNLVNQIAFPLNKLVWKLKIPLKIKVFVWFVLKGVILTKDNMLKRNWRGDDKCCFCNNKETIHRLFFGCHVAQFVWRVVQFAFGLRAPTNIADISGVCLQQINRKMRPQVCVGVCAIFWSIWLCRNDAVLMRKDYIIICRLFSGPLIGRGSGPSFKRRKTERV